MTLAIGSRIGAFEVIDRLGAGGMGEVYRARDLRLHRDVAIKVLPASFALDADRRARFDREARTLAALNHPNIATLFAIEDSPAGQVLVMELVDGETLSDRIALADHARLPMREALAIAEQIAAALETAHEHGIVHRDLKPANVAVRRDGTVKVLDFGLAKALASAPETTATAAAVTVTSDAAGFVGPGTPAYMSPEQARGVPVDTRTDIWAFGCVLYELLTGIRPFTGDRTSEVLARVLERDPDFTALPPDTAPAIRRLVRRCLEKDPRQRLRDIGDARLELRDALVAPAEQGPGQPVRQRAARTSLAAAAALGVVFSAIVAGVAWWQGGWRPSPAREAFRLMTMLPDGVTVTRGPGFASSVAVAPDGQLVVIAGTGRDGQRLYRWSRDRFEAVPVAGTERGSSPFFSWDGAWIGFFADGRLKRIPADGGTAVDIVTLNGFPAGASWGPDDRIVFSYGAATPLHIVNANGGQAERLIEGRNGYRPDVVPDSRTILYESAGWVYAFDRQTRRETRLVRGTDPRFVDGRVVFARGNTLLAASVDLSRHALVGAEVAVVESVADEPATSGGMAHYGVSRAGTLAYVPAANAYSLVLVQPDGTERMIADAQSSFENPRFSPTGTLVVVATTRRRSEPADLWLHDLRTGTTTRLTSGGGRAPIWRPDGTTVMYSHLGDAQGVYEKRVDGQGEARQVLAVKAFHWLVGWVPTTRTLAYAVMEGTPSSIMALADGKSQRVVGPGQTWGGRLSPDGRWLVYYSLDSGNFEVLVTPFPAGGSRWPIADGTDPAWSPDGKEIYYRNANRLMAVRVDTTAGVRAVSKPRVVVDPFLPPLYDDYDVRPDGAVLVVRPATTTQPRQVNVVLDWSAELSRLLAPGQ